MYYTYMKYDKVDDETEVFNRTYKATNFVYTSVSIQAIYKSTQGRIIGVDIKDEVTKEVLIGVPFDHFINVMCDKHTYFYNFKYKRGQLRIKAQRGVRYPRLIVQMHEVQELVSHFRMYSYDNMLVLNPVVYGVVDCEPLYGVVVAQHRVDEEDSFYGEQYVRVISKGVTRIENGKIVFNNSSSRR